MPTITPTPADVACATDILDTIVGINGERLVVVHRYNLDLETNTAEAVAATSDGRHPNLYEWHTEADGPESEWIAYERIGADGTGSHGFVDSVSRKVLQTG